MNEYILLVYNNDTQFKPAQAQGIRRRVPDQRESPQAWDTEREVVRSFEK